MKRTLHISKVLTDVQMATLPERPKLITAGQVGNELTMIFAALGDQDENWSITTDLAAVGLAGLRCLGVASASLLSVIMP